MANPHPNMAGLKRTAGPGRPKGSKNKLTRDIERFFASEKYAKSAKDRMEAGKAPHLESYWLNLICGKPKEQVELTIPEPVVVRYVDA